MSSALVAVLGARRDAPVQMLLDALEAEGVPTLHLCQRRSDTWPDVQDVRITGLYLRPLDARRLHAGDPARAAAAEARTHAWCDLAERCTARVANRPGAMASNGSKPYQAQRLMALGFDVPPTLLTDEPEAVLAFEREHGPLIYKSASGVRSIVRPFDAAARARLPLLRHCPVQFQKRLAGTNVRVHVVGSAAFAVESTATASTTAMPGRKGTRRRCGPPRSTSGRAGAASRPRTRWTCSLPGST